MEVPLLKALFKAWKEKLQLLRANQDVYRCCCALTPRHPFHTTLPHLFIALLACLQWPHIIRLFALLLPPCGKSYRMQLAIWQIRKHMSSCHITIQHFLYPQLQGPRRKAVEGGNSTSVYLYNVFTYVRCSERFLKPLKQGLSCFSISDRYWCRCIGKVF